MNKYIKYISPRPSCETLHPRGLASFNRHQLLNLSWAELLENVGVGRDDFPPGRVDAVPQDTAVAESVLLKFQSNHLQLEQRDGGSIRNIARWLIPVGGLLGVFPSSMPQRSPVHEEIVLGIQFVPFLPVQLKNSLSPSSSSCQRQDIAQKPSARVSRAIQDEIVYLGSSWASHRTLDLFSAFFH